MTEHKGLKFIEAMMLLYLVLWTVSPPLQIDLIYRLAAVVCMGVLFLVRLGTIRTLEWQKIAAMVFLLIIAIVAYISDGTSGLLRPIAYYLMILIYILFFSTKEEWKEYSYLIPIVLIALAVWNFRSAVEVARDPTIARLIVRNDEEIYIYMRRGVGGYGLVYSQVCIFPALLAWTFKSVKKNLFGFIVGAVWLVSYFSFIPNSGYSIANAVTVIGILLLLFYRRRSAVLAFGISILLIAAAVWAIGYIDGFREWLLRIFDGTKVAVKVEDIYTSIMSPDMADSISSRILRYRASLESIFVRYPVIGGLWRGGAGGHSALLDMFAQYGLFGGYMFYTVFFEKVRRFKYESDDSFIIRVCNATFVSMMLVITLDSAPYQLMLTCTVVLPIVLSILENWRKPDEDPLDGEPDTE